MKQLYSSFQERNFSFPNCKALSISLGCSMYLCSDGVEMKDSLWFVRYLGPIQFTDLGLVKTAHHSGKIILVAGMLGVISECVTPCKQAKKEKPHTHQKYPFPGEKG